MTDAQAINSEPAPPAGTKGNNRKRLLLLVLVPLLAVLIAGVAYLRGGRYVETENAYIKADKIPVSAEVSGIVSELLVKENQAVVAGQPLFRLDPAEFQLAVARTEAELAQVRTDLAALKANYREKQAEIQLARTRQAFAEKEQLRQADLLAQHFISASSFDDAKQENDLARQEISVLEQDLKRIGEALGGGTGIPVEQHPAFLGALARLEQAQLDLKRTEVRASLAGIVSKLPKPGQHIASGTIALILVASGNLWVEANFTETDLTHVKPGQPVTINVDTYPDTEWKGVVESLSPATGAEFSVIPAQNATGNWVKIGQRLPVRISIETTPDMPQLRAGLSTIVKIDTGHHRRLPGLSF